MPAPSPQDNDCLTVTGVPGLDDILGGGLPTHRLYLVEGEPGAGKTTLAFQFLQEGVRKGDRCLYVTLTETEEEVQSVAASHGWTLDGIDILEMSPSEEDLAADAQNTMFHPSELELSQATRGVLAEVERLMPARLVFDSVSELRLLAQDSLRYRRQVLALKRFLVGRQCTVLLLDDKTTDGPDEQLRSIAHGVISLEHRSPDYGVTQRRVQVVKMRGRQFRAGFHDFVIRPGGLVVFPRLIAAEHREEYPSGALSSGIGELDALLSGGLERGTSTLFLGPAGSGKSSLAMQYATAAAARGEKAAVFAFEETLRSMVERATRLGMDFEGQVLDGAIAVRQIDPAELSPGEFAHLVRDAVDGAGAKVVVIDSLNGYLNAMPDGRFLMLHLHELLTYLGQRGVTSILVVAQHGLVGSSMITPVDASYLADSVLLLRFFEAAGEVRQALSVVKKRAGAHERSIREFRLIEGEGIRLGGPLREFEGILTGVPRYTGGVGPLIEQVDGV